jgi:hypothetical protein
MKNKGVVGLVVAAVVLFVLAFALSRGSTSLEVTDGGPKGDKKPKKAVVYPRDQARAKKSDGALATDRAPPPPEKPKNLDAMQRALLGPGKKGAVFVEANAIRHSPLMEKILRCRDKDAADGLERMKNELGIDPMEDVDRIGFDGDVFVASGFFDNLKLPPEIGEGAAYGDGGRIWHEKDKDGTEIFFGKLGNGMLLTGGDEAAVKGAIDRAEGRGDVAGADALPPGFGEGEIYGSIGPEFIKSVLAGTDDPTAKQIAELVTSSTVRMNVDEDAALSVDLQAVDEKAGEDLANAMKGAFALLRSRAEQEGDTELAQLLEQARVTPKEGGRFDLDVAVPGEALLKGMGCDAEGNALVAGPKASPR